MCLCSLSRAVVLTETGAALLGLPLLKVSGHFAVAAAAVSAGVCAVGVERVGGIDDVVA